MTPCFCAEESAGVVWKIAEHVDAAADAHVDAAAEHGDLTLTNTLMLLLLLLYGKTCGFK